MSLMGRARIGGAYARIWTRVEGEPGLDGTPTTTWSPAGYTHLLCETATAETAQRVFGVEAVVAVRAAGDARAARAGYHDGVEIAEGEFAGRYLVEGVIPPPTRRPRAHVEYGLRRLGADEAPLTFETAGEAVTP
jgi:hypothetical protein